MIITLKNANFMDSNIGTLYTWRVTRQLGAGAIYSGAASVLKGESFAAVITIDDSYELGAAGVTVTMGGIPISAYTIADNVITISIAKVTGNVNIKVPTTPKVIDQINLVFDFDFTTHTFADYASQGIFTVPANSTLESITYNSLYGANLNNNLPNGLTLVNPIDASRAWTLEFSASMAQPTDLTGNRRAFITGIDALAPFVVISFNGTVDNSGFQISNGTHTWTGMKQLTFDQEVFYKIVHNGSNQTFVYKDGVEIGKASTDWTGK